MSLIITRQREAFQAISSDKNWIFFRIYKNYSSNYKEEADMSNIRIINNESSEQKKLLNLFQRWLK